MTTRPSPRFTAAIFDMDGLLLDTERPVRDAWLAATAALDLPVTPADYQSLIGLNHTAARARMLGWLGGDAARLEAAGAHAQALLLARPGGPGFALKPGVRALLDGLKRAGVPCAVATSTLRPLALERLRDAGLLDAFDAIGTGDEVVHGKPAPDLYRLVLGRLGGAVARTLVFEDSGHGVQAALAAGLAVVNVPDLQRPEPAWQARCLAVLPSLEAIGPHLADWFGIAGAGTAVGDEPQRGIASGTA